MTGVCSSCPAASSAPAGSPGQRRTTQPSSLKGVDAFPLSRNVRVVEGIAEQTVNHRADVGRPARALLHVSAA